MDDEDFLAAVEADNRESVEEEQPEQPQAEPEAKPEGEGRPRDEHGRFKPKEEAPQAEAPQPEPAAPPPPPAVPAPPVQPEPGFVPISVILDERDKRQQLEAEVNRLRAAQPAPQVEIPDRELDPEGYFAFQQANIQQQLVNQTLNTSERFARKEHGPETVDAAKAWALQRFGADPLYQQQILRDPDPYEKVVTDYKRDQLFSKVSDPSEFDAFLEWKAAQAQLQQQGGAPPPPPNPTPSIPPRSLASAPSAGSIREEAAQSDEEMFDEVIGKR